MLWPTERDFELSKLIFEILELLKSVLDILDDTRERQVEDLRVLI